MAQHVYFGKMLKSDAVLAAMDAGQRQINDWRQGSSVAASETLTSVPPSNSVGVSHMSISSCTSPQKVYVISGILTPAHGPPRLTTRLSNSVIRIILQNSAGHCASTTEKTSL